MVVNHETRAANPRVLLFSQRNIYEREVWRCSFLEFEDLLPRIDDVEIIAPNPRSWYPHGKRLASRLGKHIKYPLNPGIVPVPLDREYDLFCAIIEKPSELLQLKGIPNWKEKCRKSICWVIEFYESDISHYASALEVMSQFDQVAFMFVKNDAFKARLGGRGTYVAPAVDALAFAPHPNPLQRVVDVLSIGRRAPETHEALLEMAARQEVFYVYDTINDLHAHDLWHHRLMMRNMLKRTRYFLVNPGKMNRPDETKGQVEFGYRYFEGAAPGAVLIGEYPKSTEFSRIFHWPDAVIHMPVGSDRIGDIIRDLDKQPERIAKLRLRNTTECLLHNDWCHRWEQLLHLVGMEPLPALHQRKDRLRTLASAMNDSRVGLNAYASTI
jgi:hypothetical protein